MTRFYAGMLTGIAGVLGGGWLLAAPFALGYQPDNAAWVDATKVDVFTGLGILALGLLTVAGFTRGLVAALRAEGALTPRPRHAAPSPQEQRAATTSESVELQRVIARLASALEDHESKERGTSAQTGVLPDQMRRPS